MFEKIKVWARKLKTNLLVLYYSYHDRRVPWHAKVTAMIVVGYAFSPIDFIPDFIPILGYLDDIILVPLGIALVIKLMPDDVFKEYKEKVNKMKKGECPKSWITGGLIVTLWILILSIAILLYW